MSLVTDGQTKTILWPTKLSFSVNVLHGIRGLHNVTTKRMTCELKYQINVSLTDNITSYAINKGRL